MRNNRRMPIRNDATSMLNGPAKLDTFSNVERIELKPENRKSIADVIGPVR